MDDVLIAADSGEVRHLLTALDEGGVGCVVIERTAAVEHAVQTSRASLVVCSESVAAELLRRLRLAHPDRLLVVWLDRASSSRAAELLEEGAAEVLDATMGAAELLARLRNASGRVARMASGPVELGPLRVDAGQGVASWAGADLQLTRREREVLTVLAEAAGRTLRREELYRRVWGFAMARGDRTVDVNVKRIRDKLAAAGAAVVVVTQPGVGYRLDLPLAAPEPAVTGL